MAVCCSPGALLAIQPPLSTAPRSSSNRRRQSSSSLFAIRENVPGIKFITEGNLPAILSPWILFLFKKFPFNGFDSEKFYFWIFFYPCYLRKLMIRVDNFIFGISIIQFDTINLRIRYKIDHKHQVL